MFRHIDRKHAQGMGKNPVLQVWLGRKITMIHQGPVVIVGGIKPTRSTSTNRFK